MTVVIVDFLNNNGGSNSRAGGSGVYGMATGPAKGTSGGKP